MKRNKIFTTLALSISLLFFSGASIAKAETKLPVINAKSAVTMDLSTGEIIYAKNIDDKMYPASTTKLMTSLLLAENKQKEDILKYSKTAKAQPEYSLYTNYKAFDIGDPMSANDAMKALLLFSANDAAYVVADNIASDSAEFIKMMNDKAASLNLKNTHFVTSNGLHDPDHYTTAYDLSLIGKAAYGNEWVRETMSLKKDSVNTPKGPIYMDNRNKLLGKDGCVGGKTGYTSQAGKCLVALYERDGRSMVGVVLKADYDKDDTFVFNDMQKIINWSYDSKKIPLYEKNSVVDTVTANYKLFKFFGPQKTIEVPLITNDTIEYYENDVNKKEIKKDIDTASINPWQLSKDSKAATMTVSQRNSSKAYDLYSNISKNEIIKANMLIYILSAIAFVLLFLVVIFVILTFKKMSRRKSRRRY